MPPEPSGLLNVLMHAEIVLIFLVVNKISSNSATSFGLLVSDCLLTKLLKIKHYDEKLFRNGPVLP